MKSRLGGNRVSEFSSSFHIRTNSAPKTERSLRKAKMSGLVFGPANGWLTFVPYPHSEGIPDVNDRIGTASAIALATEKTVLQFEYAEDHLWSFALVKPDQSTAIFACEWDQEPPAIHDDFDRSALEGIAAVSLIEPFLVDSRAAEDGTPHAYGFAEKLGLPAYRWLSPGYVEKDTQHFINEGAREIGRKPATTRVPPRTKLDLPKPDLTAREALVQLKPMLTWCRPSWTLRMVSGTSRQGWDFRYYNAELRETVQGYLFSNGNAGFKSLGRAPEPISHEELARMLAAWRADPKRADWVKKVEATMSAPPIPTALPDQWLDSDEVLAIADTIEPPEELSKTSLIRYLSLQCDRNPPARWHVMHVTARSGTDAGHAPRWSVIANRLQWTIELDAQTGKCLREVLSRPGEGHDSFIISPWRERIEGGPWRDI
jgi:hypothetical protein